MSVSSRAPERPHDLEVRIRFIRQNASRVVGYFAALPTAVVLCTGDLNACVIGGTADAVRAYVWELDEANANTFAIRKTRFIDILRGMNRGGAYGFDREAYQRFFPLARGAGFPVVDGDFDKARVEGYRFFTVNPYVIRDELRVLVTSV